MNYRQRAIWIATSLGLLLPLLVLVSTAYSETGQEGIFRAMQAILRLLGVMDRPAPEQDIEQRILILRLFRALCAVGVGGSLALAGAMSQGLFRNPLASPDLLGLGSGAMLGAVLAIAILGGYGPEVWSSSRNAASGSILNHVASLGIVPIFAFAGALVTALAIYRLATRHGRISVPALLLTGLAINSLLSSMMAGLQVLLLEDWQVSRAIVSWGFGTLDDRSPFHLLIVFCGAALALVSIPFIGLELDLLAGGEEDAAALGADPTRVKMLVLACVALSTAASVSVSGQIAFIGLLVPHVMRMLVGPHHRALLPVSFLAGATLLLSVVIVQHALCPVLAQQFAASGHSTLALAFNRFAALQPGVLTSLLGAPFFIYLLLRQENRLRIW